MLDSGFIDHNPCACRGSWYCMGRANMSTCECVRIIDGDGMNLLPCDSEICHIARSDTFVDLYKRLAPAPSTDQRGSSVDFVSLKQEDNCGRNISTEIRDMNLKICDAIKIMKACRGIDPHLITSWLTVAATAVT